MLSLQEAMQLDFAGGSLEWLEDMDLAAPGFGFEEFASVDDGSCSAVSAEICTPPAPVDVARDGEGDEEEERRLRRKISNRESARRSRARKRRREEELEGALEALRGENRALATTLDAASRRALAVGLDTARLHAEAGALRRRLSEAQRSAVVMLAMSRLLQKTAGLNGAVLGRTVPSVQPPQPAQASGVVSTLMS